MGLVSFYRDGDVDDAGRTFEEVLAFDNDQLEGIHDYIQWLFPLPEQSSCEPDAPTLTAADLETFRSDPAMQENMRRAFNVMLSFYGFKDTGEKVGLAENFNDRSDWLSANDRVHNFMRISRILRSLRIAGLEEEAQRFFGRLDRIYRHPVARELIGEKSYGFWKQRVSEPAP